MGRFGRRRRYPALYAALRRRTGGTPLQRRRRRDGNLRRRGGREARSVDARLRNARSAAGRLRRPRQDALRKPLRLRAAHLAEPRGDRPHRHGASRRRRRTTGAGRLVRPGRRRTVRRDASGTRGDGGTLHDDHATLLAGRLAADAPHAGGARDGRRRTLPSHRRMAAEPFWAKRHASKIPQRAARSISSRRGPKSASSGTTASSPCCAATAVPHRSTTKPSTAKKTSTGSERTIPPPKTASPQDAVFSFRSDSKVGKRIREDRNTIDYQCIDSG